MSKLAVLCAVFVALAAVPQAPRAIDPTHSRASFSVAHIWVERVTGMVPIVGGMITLALGSSIPTSVHAELDATRIETGEPDRDRSLESPGFFDTARYPRWTFTSTHIVPQGNDAFEMDGDLTLHGVTQPERLNVTIGGSVDTPVYRVTAKIDRHAFGMPLTRLDPAIGSTVDVTLDIALK